MRRHHTSDDVLTTFGMLEQVATLHHARLIVPDLAWTSYGAKPVFPPELSSSYGDWHDVSDSTPIDPTKVFIIPGYCGGSDYSGDLVEVSNYKAVLDMLPSDYEDGIDYITYTGGHGTFDVAIRLDRLTAELLETFTSLEDYPLIDESLHSELEMESQNEAWESDIRSDFKTALGKFLYQTWEDSTQADQRADETDDQYAERVTAVEEFLSDECGMISDSDLGTLCWKMADLANVYWTNEQGSGSWLDVDDVLKGSIGRNLNAPHTQDYHREGYAEIKGMIQDFMSDQKYDLGIVRYINPDQLTLSFSEVN
jgi:hypothetical protein